MIFFFLIQWLCLSDTMIMSFLYIDHVFLIQWLCLFDTMIMSTMAMSFDTMVIPF